MHEDLSAAEFEDLAAELLKRAGLHLSEPRVETRTRLTGLDGTYEVDVTARFQALGVEFLVLIECKHHRSPIKRDVVQVLHDRIRALGAQKGILFSTAPFQSGAVTYARAHGIALIRVMSDQPVAVTRKPSGRRPSNAAAGWIPWIDEATGEVSYILLERRPVEVLLRELNLAEPP